MGVSTLSLTAGKGYSGVFHLLNMNASAPKALIGPRPLWFTSSSAVTSANLDSVWNGAAAADGIQCQMSSGNISTGVIKIIGIRNAL
jgi:hypothetical protein